MERVTRKRKTSKKMEEFIAAQKAKSKKSDLTMKTVSSIKEQREFSTTPTQVDVQHEEVNELSMGTSATTGEPKPADMSQESLSLPDPSIYPRPESEITQIYTPATGTVSELEVVDLPSSSQITISQTETDKDMDMNQVEVFQNEFNLPSQQTTDAILSEIIEENIVSNDGEMTPMHIVQSIEDAISVTTPLNTETAEPANHEQTSAEMTANSTNMPTRTTVTVTADSTERRNVTVNKNGDGVYQVISNTGEMLDAESFLTEGGITSQQLINLVSVHADEHFSSDAEVYFLDIVVENQKGYQETFHVTVNNNDTLTMQTCEFCDYRSDRKNMKKHVKFHLESRPFSCDFCSHKSRTTTNLKRHLLTHTNERNYGCPHCDLRFKQKIHLDKHISYRHSPKTVKCELCDYTCANVTPDLKLHLKRKHLKNSIEDPPIFLECSKCGFLAASKKDLQQHIKFHKAGPELKLYCELCSFVTDCRSRLTRHKLTHTKSKPYKCQQCDYRASQKVHVSRHMRSKHNILINSADIVETTDVEMGERTEIISEETNHEISTRPSLDEPSSSTQSEEPILMDPLEHSAEDTNADTSDNQAICAVPVEQSNIPDISDIQSEPQQISFNQSKTLTVQVDQSETVLTSKLGTSLKYGPKDYTNKPKVFACTHCTMKFVKLLSLYKHLHTQHEDQLESEDRLTCVICDYKGSNHRSLLLHMRRHNQNESVEESNDRNDQLYMCVLCRYMNTKKKNLYQHLKNKHKINLAFRKQESTSTNENPVVVIAHENGTELTQVVQLGNDGVGKCSLSTRFLNIKDLKNSCDITANNSNKHSQGSIVETVHDGLEQTAAEAIVHLGTDSELAIEEQLVETIPLPHTDFKSHYQTQEELIHDEPLKLSMSQIGSLKEGDILQIDGESYQISVNEDGNITATKQETLFTTEITEQTVTADTTSVSVQSDNSEQTTLSTNCESMPELDALPASVTVIL